jgi:hypothetical protein
MRPLRPALAAAALFAAASFAFAGQVLEMKTGELVPGRVKALDDEGVTFVPEKGGEMRVLWERVWPANRFTLWESTLASDDAEGRVKLGLWALGAELFGPSRRALMEAKGLGYAGGEDLDARLADVRRAEADDALSDVDALVAKGELEKAMERVRAFLRVSEPGADADRVRTKVPDLLERIERRDEEKKAADEARAKAEKEGKLRDWIAKNMKDADEKKAEGGRQASAAYTQLAGGNQTRAREALGRAESAYRGARETYQRVRKAAKDKDPDTSAECAERMKDCDVRLVEVLTRWGGLEVENKAWKRASPIVDRGLVVDPVNPELLGLRKKIDENWLRRKLSDVSNASGTTSPY